MKISKKYQLEKFVEFLENFKTNLKNLIFNFSDYKTTLNSSLLISNKHNSNK